MLNTVFFVLGLASLVLGAQWLVRGASSLALSLGISPLVVGLTVVAFGTSSPELAVSVQASFNQQADLALGNVVGSNIMNVLFILGASALIAPLTVSSQLIRQEVPVMAGFSLILLGMSLDGHISRLNGLLLFGLLVAYTVAIVVQSRRESAASASDAAVDTTPAADHWLMQLLLIGAGLALLVLGAHWLVEAAIAFARQLGVSELVIGLTIVAAGTSLPEVATSLMATIRGERDIAVGNVVGSNTFNIGAVLGISSSVSPDGIPVHASALAFDLPVMIAVALACLPIFFTGNRINRWEGALFLAMYAAYLAYLILAAQAHDALSTYSFAMAGFVLPILAVTLIVVSTREWRARAATRQQRGKP